MPSHSLPIEPYTDPLASGPQEVHALVDVRQWQVRDMSVTCASAAKFTAQRSRGSIGQATQPPDSTRGPMLPVSGQLAMSSYASISVPLHEVYTHKQL